MSIVAPPTHDRNLTLASPPSLQRLNDAMAERITLAQSLPDTPTDSDYAAFVRCETQVQAQIDAWMMSMSDADAFI